MKNRLNSPTNETNAALEAAYNEEPFSASDLIEEIAPLLADYFEGDFLQREGKIVMSFYNGQKFRLAISKVV